jgi:hypothetical protein
MASRSWTLAGVTTRPIIKPQFWSFGVSTAAWRFLPASYPQYPQGSMRAPFFSAFKLWLSTMASVGAGSRPASLRASA